MGGALTPYVGMDRSTGRIPCLQLSSKAIMAPSLNFFLPLCEKGFLLLFICASSCKCLAVATHTELQFFLFPEKILSGDRILSRFLFMVDIVNTASSLFPATNHESSSVCSVMVIDNSADKSSAQINGCYTTSGKLRNYPKYYIGK